MHNQQDPNRSCPYDQLYIYYVSGRAKTARFAMGESFIGNWIEDEFSFLFFSCPADEVVNRLLSEQEDLELVDHYTMTYEDWLGEKFEPFHIGRFTISPPWDPADNFYLPSFGAFHILLDPGVVFGTGTHPTTRDCLELLEKAVRDHKVERVLDLGCGTGLLALAAGKLRCKKILALDFNDLAVQTTLRNIRLNGMEQKIIAAQGMAEEMTDIPADLLITNIHYEVMEKIILSPGFLEKKRFILSGLLKSQAKKVRDILATLPVTILEARDQNGIWHTFYGERL